MSDIASQHIRLKCSPHTYDLLLYGILNMTLLSSFVTCVLADNNLVLFYVNIIRTDFSKMTGFDDRCISRILSQIDETQQCND